MKIKLPWSKPRKIRKFDNMFKNFKEHLQLLKSVGLFQGIDAAELETMLICIGAKVEGVRKDSIILLAGDKPRHVGIVVKGQVHIVREDFDGNRSLMAVLTPGDIFAEALCCAGVSESPVTVIADQDSTVMLLSFERILLTCPNSCPFHKKLIENMLWLIAGKNLMLQSHMEILSMKSIRAKVMRYIESFMPKQGREITIPLNREELANYLCIERSALSHELMRMKKDGLIEYRKNRFALKQHQ